MNVDAYISLRDGFVSIGMESVPITTMLDINGDETSDFNHCVSLVAGPMSNGKWLAIDLNDCEPWTEGAN